VKPNLFLVGAPKTGTTSVHDALSAHPDVFMSSVKEPNHFATDLVFTHPPNPYTDAERYLSLFAGAVGARRVGESSVCYLFSRLAAASIAAMNPDAKVLCILRSPVELVCSLHGFACRGGGEPLLQLGDALDAEADRASGRRVPRSSYAPWSLQYTSVADYQPQLERYLRHFPEEQIGIFFYEDLRDDPAGTLKTVFDFIDVSSAGVTRLGRSNVTADQPPKSFEHWLRSFPSARSFVVDHVPPGLRSRAKHVLTRVLPQPDTDARITRDDILRLEALFEPRIRRLEAFLGRSLDRWTVDADRLVETRNQVSPGWAKLP
jgi:hypothetical protein